MLHIILREPFFWPMRGNISDGFFYKIIQRDFLSSVLKLWRVTLLNDVKPVSLERVLFFQLGNLGQKNEVDCIFKM